MPLTSLAPATLPVDRRLQTARPASMLRLLLTLVVLFGTLTPLAAQPTAGAPSASWRQQARAFEAAPMAEETPAPIRLDDASTPSEVLAWLVRSDQSGRQVGGILQAGVGYTIAAAGAINMAGGLNMGFGSTTRRRLYYTGMMSLGASTGTAGLLLRPRPSRVEELHTRRLWHEGADDDTIRTWIYDRALTARRARHASGLTNAGFGVAALVVLESISDRQFGGDSLQISLLFSSTTIAAALASLALRTPEERAARALHGLAAPASARARWTLGPGSLSVAW
jgi:hypothetical protein